MKVWVDVIDGDGGWYYRLTDLAEIADAGPFDVDEATVTRWKKTLADYEAMQDELQALTDTARDS